MKIWRRLQGIGAVAIKNSVYVLPKNEQSQEDFEWLLAELTAVGAEAALLESQFVSGMDDQEVRDLFNSARNDDYSELMQQLKNADQGLAKPSATDSEPVQSARQALIRARKRLADIEAIDHFGAAEHDAAQAALWRLEERLAGIDDPVAAGEREMKDTNLSALKARTWVTRRNVHVDRIASAWLIRRWIDPDARFKFVGGQDYSPRADEIRFDMFEAEFTHEGNHCTFEVLARHAAPDDAALSCVGEVVHDIDLKDHKFGRPETVGVASLLSGLVASLEDDVKRIERGFALFEDLYTHFKGAAD